MSTTFNGSNPLVDKTNIDEKTLKNESHNFSNTMNFIENLKPKIINNNIPSVPPKHIVMLQRKPSVTLK